MYIKRRKDKAHEKCTRHRLKSVLIMQTHQLLNCQRRLAVREWWIIRTNTTAVFHTRSRVLEDGLLILHGATPVANIRRKHLRQLIPLPATAATFNLDLCAVHVHLAIPLKVEPGPREQSFAAWNRRRDCETIVQGERASALHGVDDFETLAVVEAEGELAGPAAVVGALMEFHGRALARFVRRDGAPGGVEVVASAREIGA